MSLALAVAAGIVAIVSLAGIVQASGGGNGGDGDGNGGVFPCPAGYTSIKVDPPVSGTYGGIVVTFSADVKSVSFVSPFDIDVVIVKGGPDANVYGPNSHGLPAKSLSGLVAPLNPGGQQPQISFVTFCFTDGATPTGTAGAATHTPVKTPTVGGATHTPVTTHTPKATHTPDDNGGIFPCPEGYSSIKVDPPVSGTYGGIVVTFSADLKSVSFVSPFPIDIVIVKGGPDANIYGPNSDGLPATSLSGLTAPLNPGGQQPEISFVTFCFRPASVTPTATATAAITTATATNTAVAPTNTPTATGTAEVSTNTPTATNTPSGPTDTPTATNTPGGPTDTPTATGTAAVSTNTPTATATVGGNGFTPPDLTGTTTATGTAAAATTTPTTQGVVGAATNTPQQGVLGAQVTPAARGGVTLPSAGGGDGDSGGYALAWGALALAGAGFGTLLLMRRRIS